MKRNVKSIVNVAGVPIGDPGYKVLASGQCATDDKLMETGIALHSIGVDIIRAGAFKPRSRPTDFQGEGMRGIERLIEVREVTGLPFVTEATGITRPRTLYDDEPVLEPVAEHADMIQIGTMSGQQDFLSKVAQISARNNNRPILFKRPLGLTIPQYLQRAEYLKVFGNDNIVLCLRGTDIDESYKEKMAEGLVDKTRYKPDYEAIPQLIEAGYPVIYDPSHTAGRRDLVLKYARLGLEYGAHGLIIESHINPDHCFLGTNVCDHQQLLRPIELEDLAREMGKSPDVAARTQSTPVPAYVNPLPALT